MVIFHSYVSLPEGTKWGHLQVPPSPGPQACFFAPGGPSFPELRRECLELRRALPPQGRNPRNPRSSEEIFMKCEETKWRLKYR